MRVVVVGPVSPCRGGISYYTTELSRRLGKKHQVTVYSFERLYAGFISSVLLKGNSVADSSKQIVDMGVENKKIISINPFSWIKTAAKISQLKPDVVLITWIDPYLFPLFKSIELFLPKSTKLIFICHNVFPHKHRMFAKQLAKSCFKRANGFITHAASETKDLLVLMPDATHVQAYLPAYTLKSSGKSIKEELKLRDNTLIFFGYVRPYKGLRHLLKALPLILKKVDIDLLIVGEFWEDKKMYLKIIDELGISKHVKIVDKYVPNEDIGRYFAAADVAVLPYESGTQSAVVQVAYAHDTPIISTKVGGLAETVFDGKTGYLVEPCNEQALANAIIKFYKEKKRAEFVKNVKKHKQKFSWGEYMRRLESLF
jgi:glycosyltransferase involved in cell wall biosynthesis